MSATTVLVPVLEPEAEALVEGGARAAEAQAKVLDRARRLRPRVARVDAIREDLHALLFPKWADATSPRPSGFSTLLKKLAGKRTAPARVFGYDPFVHVFGRSLPVDAPNSSATADRLRRLLAMDDAAFETALTADLRGLDPRAAELYAKAPSVSFADELERLVAQDAGHVAAALAHEPPRLRDALNAIVRLSAWSWPVWRFDGEMLPDLLRTIGVTVEAGGAGGVFEALVERRPELADHVKRLPRSLADFAGAGAFLTSTDVKLIAGSLRLHRARIAQNAEESGEDPRLTLRHVRLLEEAVFFCEAEGLALGEAAGVEWHDRPR